MSNKLFTFGMFRSGTTFLSRLINAHPEILCASEPYLPFFKWLRNDVARVEGIDIPQQEPFHSYYADSETLPLYRSIQGLDNMDRPFPDDEREPLRERIHERHQGTGDPVDEPDIMDALNEITGGTFGEVYESLFSLISQAYDKPSVEWVGTKETWITEFSPVLSRQYPDARFIFIVRDPRAVLSSSNKSFPKKSWLFLVRQWRKLAMLSWLYAHEKEFSDRTLLIQYENLIREPETVVENICELLDLETHPAMLDPSSFTDPGGREWTQNTSFSNPKKTFDTSAIDRWKSTLDPDVVRFVEELSYEEMSLFGYDFVEATTGDISTETLFSPPEVSTEEMPDWFLDFRGPSGPLDQTNELSKELTRKRLLSLGGGAATNVPEDIRDGYFLEPAIHRRLADIDANQ